MIAQQSARGIDSGFAICGAFMLAGPARKSADLIGLETLGLE